MRVFFTETAIGSEMGGEPIDRQFRYCFVADGLEPEPFLLDAIAQSEHWDESIQPQARILWVGECTLSDAWDAFWEEIMAEAIERSLALDVLAKKFRESMVVGNLSEADIKAIDQFVHDVFEED